MENHVALSAGDAVEALKRAVARGDDDWTLAVALEARDQLREALSQREGGHAALERAWASCPAGLEAPWHVLLAALAGHEFEDAGVQAPGWTVAALLDSVWVLDTPRLIEAEVRAETPKWLAQRNIFVAVKDLGTL